ncbi:O-antigen ligase family protein [Blastococcus sp. SYSU DS0539]
MADVALALAVCLALLRAEGLSAVAQRILRGVVVYQAILLIPVVVHPTPDAVIDWAHRFFLMAGGLLVGSELARSASRARALRVFVYTCAAMGGLSAVQAVLTAFDPVYPLGISKNLAGEVLAAGVLVGVAVGKEVLGSATAQAWAVSLAGVGLLATQSRGAWLGLGAALVIWFVYSRPSRRVVFAMAVVAVGASSYIATSLASESGLENSRQTSSLESRQYFEQIALGYFEDSPIVGQGIRYYLDPAFDFPVPLDGDGVARASPHNVIVETLSESGLVGLAAFSFLIGHTGVVLLRCRTAFSMLALSSLLGNLVHGLVDIYWLAGSLTVVWVLIGLATGASDSNRPKPRVRSEALVPARVAPHSS